MDTKRLAVKLFEAIDVWKRISETRVVCYRCFKNLSTGLHSVQSADFFEIPLDASRLATIQQQQLQLFAEQDPDDRAGAFPTLSEAIESHESDFE